MREFFGMQAKIGSFEDISIVLLRLVY